MLKNKEIITHMWPFEKKKQQQYSRTGVNGISE